MNFTRLSPGNFSISVGPAYAYRVDGKAGGYLQFGRFRLVLCLGDHAGHPIPFTRFCLALAVAPEGACQRYRPVVSVKV